MTNTRTKPGGWGYAEVLTHDQISAIDANIENTLDKRSGQTDTLASDVIVSGHTDFTGPVTFENTVVVEDQLYMNGGYFVGKMVFPVKAVTAASYTIDTTTADYILFVDTTSNAITINLPAASASAGRVLIIKSVANSGTNNITIARNGTNSIEGLAANYVMDADYQSITLACYNAASGWFIIATA